MESVRKAKSRLQNYPILLGKCGLEASAYGKCVAEMLGEVKRDQCQPEFELFKKCIVTNAKKLGTKM
jgi:hypothetical protein